MIDIRKLEIPHLGSVGVPSSPKKCDLKSKMVDSLVAGKKVKVSKPKKRKRHRVR